MVFKTICFVLTIFEIAAMGFSKHAVKTIKTEYGDIYDCVDFYKQPAFDHPLLKNHSFHPEMRPSFHPQKITNNVLSNLNATEIEITPLKDGGCPKGTVPIRRIKKNQDHRLRYSTNGYIGGTIFSLGQTHTNPGNIYNGVGAVISVFKPRVLTTQYSSAEIIIKGGTDTIIVGWTVNPNKYPDKEPRLFTYAIAGDQHCFDAECGFVQIRPDIPLNILLKPVSIRNKAIYVFKFFVYRDTKNGAWWLQIGGIEREAITLGYWPQSIFVGLQGSGTYAACGGEAYTLPTVPPPEMGTGLFPNFYAGDDAFCTEFAVVDNANNFVYVGDIERYMNHDEYGITQQEGKEAKTYRYRFGGPTPN